MTDEEMKNDEQQMTADQYVESLNQLRNGTVSKEEYDKLMADNQKLVNALTNGGAGYKAEEEPEEPVDVEALRHSLFSPECQKKTNLQYFTEVLNLRKTLLDAGGDDVFLPHNTEYRPTAQDEADAERIATQLQECIEYADGDPRVFNVELQRRCGMRRK